MNRAVHASGKEGLGFFKKAAGAHKDGSRKRMRDWVTEIRGLKPSTMTRTNSLGQIILTY